MRPDDLPGTQGFGISELVGAVFDDVEDGLDILVRGCSELVFGRWMSSWYGLALYGLVSRSFDAKRS